MNCFKSAVAFFFLFFLHGTSIGNGQQGISYNGLRLCVCLPLAQGFKLPQMLMGQIAQNRCYRLAAVNYRKIQIEALNKKN